VKAARRAPEWPLTSESEEKLRNFTIPADDGIRSRSFLPELNPLKSAAERDKGGKKTGMAMIRLVKHAARVVLFGDGRDESFQLTHISPLSPL
jgi:hypothetical protein